MKMDDFNEILENFEKENGFSTMPEVVSDVLYSLESDRTALNDVAKIIKKDPGFAANILKYANSGAYLLSRAVFTVEQAVRTIGLGPLKGLCLALPVFTKFRHVPGVGEIWDHCRATAVCCQTVARAINFSEPDIAETSGLLHDIGKVVLAVSAANFFQSQIQVADSPDRDPDWRQEKKVLGFNHCFIGAWFARKFRLPSILVDGILWHHEFEKSSYGRDLTCLTFIGDQLAAAIGRAHPDFVFVEPEFERALSHMKIDNHLLPGILQDCITRIDMIAA
ncbi:MAG: HDOD domain-containing protein [Nitrospirae bacterium]|nr:HDOD domain-containing protein [Nitrospirota bacterium]MCL5286073.1 HDOD domain-containing protein [Nitrospirota bacterium]